ncbi:hypothetical protein ACLVWQ_08410 [Streptomyces sp. CWNU-52B]|uniref:hypothetical protein n=1 Tax=unclassified Streptomyces TaxID=2593676 RepID=UPI0039BF628D
MNTTQLEGLIGMLTVLGILVLLVLPSVFGIVHDRRVDRQLREAERGAPDRAPGSPSPRARTERALGGISAADVTRAA